MNCLLRRLLACSVAYAYLGKVFVLFCRRQKSGDCHLKIIKNTVKDIVKNIVKDIVKNIVKHVVKQVVKHIVKHVVKDLLNIFASFCCLLKTETKCAGCLLLKLTPLRLST